MIEFQHVFKSYGRSRNILADVNFTIKPGEFVFVSGPSGAGKSTLLNLVGGLEQANRGVVIVNGHNMHKLNKRTLPYLRRSVGLILQDANLLFDRNAFNNVLLPLAVIGVEQSIAKTRARAAMEKVGLRGKEDMFPVELSGGEQQRLAIARAIVGKPAILIADEPTANLDAKSAKLIMDVFRDFNQFGVTTLIASHDKELMANYANRKLHLDNGRFNDSQLGLEAIQ